MRIRDLQDMEVKPMYDPGDVARWTGGSWLVRPSAPPSGASIDSRTIEEGDLFFAIRGEQADGHAFIHDAFARGASAVVVDHPACLNGMGLPALVVPDTRRALMDMARHYRRTLRCRMAAVTGSVGKTTVKELAADILGHIGITVRTRGNWNNDLGMPLSLLKARADAEYGVFEVGMNHPGELDPLCAVLVPDISVVTCVGPVHIENFENEEGIAVEKGAVYRALGAEGIAVLNADDRHVERLRVEAGGRRIVTVSARPGADYVYRRPDPARGHFIIEERATGDAVDFHAALPGEYFVVDAVLAVAVARSLRASWNAAVDAVRNYHPLSMRWNRHVWFGVHTINDAYNANPVSVRAAVQAFHEDEVRGDRWLVLGGMLELGTDERAVHEALGAFLARQPGLRLLAVGTRGAWIAEGARAGGMPADHITAPAKADEAAAFLHEHLMPGDAVLFKGSRGEAVETVLKEWIRLKEAGQ